MRGFAGNFVFLCDTYTECYSIRCMYGGWFAYCMARPQPCDAGDGMLGELREEVVDDGARFVGA